MAASRRLLQCESDGPPRQPLPMRNGLINRPEDASRSHRQTAFAWEQAVDLLLVFSSLSRPKKF
jgi:hypothetical protein